MQNYWKNMRENQEYFERLLEIFGFFLFFLKILLLLLLYGLGPAWPNHMGGTQQGRLGQLRPIRPILFFFFFLFFTLDGLDSTQPFGLGWKGSSPTHVSGILPFACKKYSTCKWLWRSFKEEKWEEDLPGRRRKEAGGVSGGTRKIDVWLVAATSMKMRWLQWRKKG